MVYSTLLASWACVVAMVFQSVLAVGDKISAHPANAALVSEPLPVEILGGWKAEAKAVLQGGFELYSVESLHYAVEVMELLMLFDGVKGDDRGKHGSYQKTLCSKSSGVKVESLEDAYHMASLRRTLNCKGKAMEGKNYLVEQLGTSASVEEMLHALVARDIKDANIDLNSMCTRVASAVEGGYRDPLNTALFLSNLRVVLQREKQTLGEGKVQQFKACDKLLSSTLDVFKYNFVARGSNHPFFAPIFLFTMEKQDRPQLSAEKVNLIASQLASAVFARGDSMQAAYVLASFQVLMSNRPPPVVVSIRPNAAVSSSVTGGKVSVAVTDLRGKSLEGLTEVTVDNKKLKKNPNNTWILSVGQNVLLKPGNKKVQFNLKSSSSFGDDLPHTMTQNFKVLVEVRATALSTEVLEKGTNYPISGKVFSGKTEDTLIVSFSGKSESSALHLQKALCKLVFQHLESGHRATFTNKAEVSDSGYECVTRLKLTKEAGKFLYRSGKYQLCGSVDNEFNVVDDKLLSCEDVFVYFPDAPPKGPVPLYSRPLLYESDNALHALPEQHHTHAPPHPKAPPVAVLPFCGFVIAPFLVFAYVASRVGSNLRCRGGFLWAAVHQACLGGTLLCIVMWWFSGDFPVVRYLVPLVSVLLLCSNQLTNPSSK